jgi:hypothetical protein
MVSAVLRSFTLPTFAVAVAWALFVVGGSAQGQASTGTYGGAISLGGHDWSSFEAVPVPSAREACFVLTGDPNARPGGAVDLVTNPQGLTSRWCSATFVVKASFALLTSRKRTPTRWSNKWNAIVNWALDIFSKELLWTFVVVAVIAAVAVVSLLKNNEYYVFLLKRRLHWRCLLLTESGH